MADHDDRDDGEKGRDDGRDDGTTGASTLRGKVTEKLGWLTGDRQEEAKGRLEQAEAAGIGPGGTADDTEAAIAVDEAELQVRDEYGELAPGVGPDQGADHGSD